jgi:hypothetical protein
VYEWLYAGFWLVIGFIEHLQKATGCNYDSLTELRSANITVATTHIKSFQSAMYSSVVAWWRIPTMSSASVVTLLPAGDCTTTNHSESELLYDWRFTADQFVLAPSPLRIRTRDVFLQLNPCGYSPYSTSSLTGGWVCSKCPSNNISAQTTQKTPFLCCCFQLCLRSRYSVTTVLYFCLSRGRCPATGLHATFSRP